MFSCEICEILKNTYFKEHLQTTASVRSVASFFISIYGHITSSKTKKLQPFTKYLRLTLVFMQNSALQEKFNFCFSRVFCWYQQKFSFWQEDWALGYYSMKFQDFPNIS